MEQQHHHLAHHAQISLPHPTALTSIHASLPHFLPSPALASPVGSCGSQPAIASNAPCSTLFVANLGQFVSEHELKEIFSSFPGFCRLRMLHSKGSQSGTTTTSTSSTNGHLHGHGHATAAQAAAAAAPVAFVEYRDIAGAAAAMAALQGSFLLSSDRGAIRIEYAKSKMAAEVGLCAIAAAHWGHDDRSVYSPERARTSPKLYRDSQLEPSNVCYIRALTQAAMLRQQHLLSTRSASLQGQETAAAATGQT